MAAVFFSWGREFALNSFRHFICGLYVSVEYGLHAGFPLIGDVGNRVIETLSVVWLAE